ncbi:MAG: 30S ribosomal protein S17 [bacterium]|nr:30S ribosomal protein S17 [bacterium]
MSKRQLTGIVVSDKMQKTIVVEVERKKAYPKYKAHFRVSKKYKVHDEKKEYKTGDRIVIEECRPISKDKKWRAITKVN